MEVSSALNISAAEWQVMRVAWTLGQVSSQTVSEVLAEKMAWKAATVKTLVGRLVKKGALTATRDGKRYLYQPAISEQQAMDTASEVFINQLCQHKVGKTLLKMVEETTLSQTDIADLISTLQTKQKTAPEQVVCNCLPDNCQCAAGDGTC
ncbi:CopY/TcrY family copper transport repressor [Loigolactobacillus zhaoyuanensis]|uniref:CopY/TcrY family copper transport repressor n=1 Tax=Loigolactobacillus zhaoyuanensis TaxID=2486017 RepID=A0ABW8UCT1_9LACO|nr:CopY/TcrY family copper transport repressor [Loigolactobacillus zhaoyuanensis]